MKSNFSSNSGSRLIPEKGSESNKISALKKVTFSLIVFVGFFGIVEVLLGAISFSFPFVSANPDQDHWFELGFQQDPELPWSWIPSPGAKGAVGEVPYQFNDQGFRGAKAVSPQKQENSLRIACMGDSCTLGWEVGDDKTFCHQLGEALRKYSSQEIETINAGVPGYTTFQGLHQLTTRILPLDPDIVILSYNWNDHTYAIHLHETFQVLMHKKFYGLPDKNLPGKTFYSQAHTLIAELRTYQLVDYLIWKVGPEPKKMEEKQNSELPDLNKVPVRVSPEDYRANLKRMVQVARDHNAIPVLMTQPSQPMRSNHAFLELSKNLDFKPASDEDWDRFARSIRNRFENKQSEYNNAIREVAAANNVALVDMVPLFESDPDSDALLLDPVHPSPKGHKFIAEELKKTIVNVLNEKGN
jgi:lysophospholipase L1-like esterase